MLRFSANISVLFRELPLLERFAAARAAGFGAVEIQVPYEAPAAALVAAATASGLRVVLINAPLGPEPGAPGMACRPEHRAIFRSELQRAAEYAHALGAPCVNVLAGRAAPQEHTACLQQLQEHLCLAAEVLAPVGARALLEAVNPLDAPDYCVPSFELAAEVLGRCAGRVWLQFDVYHAARLGLEPETLFKRLLPQIAHVQFADFPGRHEPGTGGLPFPRIFRTIDASDYGGWVGAEYHPLASTRESLGWLEVSAHRQG
ncbi:MAG TPA: TIM barrel protein [Steroidobacteraceae bacterium]|nr:TIM barrel protein [Steroidobacteraceae bacterium]